MLNKSTLKVLALGVLLISLTGCQMFSAETNQAQVAVERSEVDQAPTQSPAIEDELILAGCMVLHSLQDPIQLPDGTLTSGNSLAQFILEQHIPVVWGSDEVCGGSSCSQQYCTLDGDCSYEDGQPGIDPIFLNDAIRSQSSGAIERLARELGHEAFHRMRFFGSGMITQLEEFWAFYLDTQLVKADWPRFDGIDPQDPEQLARWFSNHAMAGYLKLNPYPGAGAQANQALPDDTAGGSALADLGMQ